MKIKILTLLLVFLFHGNFISAADSNTTIALKIQPSSGYYQVIQQDNGELLFQEKDAGSALQKAIDLIPIQGGKILLSTGIYKLNSTVKLKSGISLEGMGFATVFDISGMDRDSVAFYLKDLNSVSLDNFAVKSNKNDSGVSGILADQCGSCNFFDLSFVNLGRYGIWLRNDTFLSEIRGCRFAGIKESGIFLENLNGQGRGGDFVPNLVSNCIFYGGGAGIECKYTIVLNIIGCLAYQTSRPAFYLHSNSNSILISGCRTFQIEDNAVVVDKSDEINITGNIFCWHDKNGIVLSDVTWGTISGNNIIDTGNKPFVAVSKDQAREYWKPIPENMKDYQFTGIDIRNGSRGLTVTGNAIFNWNSNPPLNYGIYEDESCESNLISSNNINYFTEKGVLSKGQNSMAVSNLEVKDAHKGNNQKVHSFDPRVIQKFIDEIGL
jgi:hypothetical protein